MASDLVAAITGPPRGMSEARTEGEEGIPAVLGGTWAPSGGCASMLTPRGTGGPRVIIGAGGRVPAGSARKESRR